LFATPFRHRRDARALWQCSGGGIAVAWFAAGDEEAGSADRTSAGEGLAQGEGGRALGARRDGVVAVLGRGPGDPARAEEGRHAPRLGGDAACSGGQGGGSLESGAG